MKLLACLLPSLALTTGCAAESAPADPVHTATLTQPGAVATIGDLAPDFTATDLDGAPFTLSEHRGKLVVLEWFNPGCPFVKAAHGEGPLATLPKRWLEKGAVWVAVNSGSPGKQGTGIDTNRDATAGWAMTYPVLLDETGAVGHAYGAKTTPQLVVVDPTGKVAFNGALDNAPLGKLDGPEHQLFVDLALQSVSTGQPVELATPKPYGCSVKYGS